MPRASSRLTQLTAKKRSTFLRVMSECGNVTFAAKAAGTSRQAVYALRERDAEFAAAWEDAVEQAADVLEREGFRRAAEGVLKPVVSAGKLVRTDDGTPLMVREYSDTMAIFLLKGLRPTKYRENVKVSGSIEHGLVPSGQAKALADELLDAVKHLPDARAALSTRLLSGGDA